MKSFFENLFGKKQEPPRIEKRHEAVQRNVPAREELELYKKGDVIGGKYDVLGKLGKGGFGIVYLVRLRDTGDVFALKTFRDELLGDVATRQAFRKEALVWSSLESHPFILSALWIQELDGRLFVMMDYVAADTRGRVSLADHLADRTEKPFDAAQALTWAIQFCLGMEHAKARGLECHRDIKPANILITDAGSLKIADFGLALAAETACLNSNYRNASQPKENDNGRPRFSFMQIAGKARCGTPGYMAPEVYRCEGTDTRSDIYSFGLVLWQIAAGSSAPPFDVPWRNDMNDFLREIYKKQMSTDAPQVHGPLNVVIQRCLKLVPKERYQNFQDLRADLEPIYERHTGKRFQVPVHKENGAAFWSNKGSSLAALGRGKDALECYEKALAIEPRNATTLLNKANALAALRRFDEAIQCYDNSLEIDDSDADAWFNKATTFVSLNRQEDAIRCFDQALATGSDNPSIWMNKGYALQALLRHETSLECYDKVLFLVPRHANAWNSKGTALAALGRREEALVCYENALAIDERDACVWFNKAFSEDALKRVAQAIRSYKRFLDVETATDTRQVAHAHKRLRELQPPAKR